MRADYEAMVAQFDKDPERARMEGLNLERVVLVNGADLTPEPVQWAWDGWLALGKVHILAGAPGQGKTTIAMAVAATMTIGGRWPDGSTCAPGSVVIWTGEDDPADTLLPRLIAAGADRARCHFVSGVDCDGHASAFDPAQHLPALHAAIQKLGDVRLLIVDPVVSAITGDSHKNTEVRRAMQPLVDLAAACGCAVLGISHFSKGGAGQDPAQRVVGSIAFTAVARVVLVAAKVKGEDGEDVRVLARGKSNIGPDKGGFRYDMEQVEALPGIQASRIAWLGAVEGSARELLAEQDDQDAADGADAVELLRQELVSDCWTPAAVASKPLNDIGLSKKQIWKACKKLGVVRKKGGFQGFTYWRLPGGPDPELPDGNPSDSANDSKGSPFENEESMESLGKVESLAQRPKRSKTGQSAPTIEPAQVEGVDFREVTL